MSACFTPRDAIAILRAHAGKPSTPSVLGESILVLIDHVVQLEQFADLVTNAVAGANTNRPTNAATTPQKGRR